MILTRDDIRELQGTGSLEVVLSKVPVKEEQSVQSAVGAPAVCVARISDSWPHRNGGFVVVLRFVKRMKPAPPRVRKVRERVRLMKPGHGTTSDLKASMRDRTAEEWDENLGPPPEPEQIDAETEEAYAKDNQRRFVKSKRKEVEAAMEECATDIERLAFLKNAAHGAGIDVRSELRATERRLLEKIDKSRKAA